jgi:hypothetical protein
VLLLPYLGGNTGATLYDFNEPWNGPNNSRLVGRMPISLGFPICGCPCDPAGWRNAETNYVMITGAGTMFENGNAQFRDIRDGPSNTIMVVEIAGSGIQWTEPRDLDLEFDKMSFPINDPSGNCISSRHPGGAVLMADGSMQFLPKDTDTSVIRALCTRDAGDGPKP